MDFQKTEAELMLAHAHLMHVVEVLLPLLVQTTFVNQILLMNQTFTAFTMKFFGMEKGALSVETLAARIIRHRTLLHNYKHPQVITLKGAYVDMKIEIGREELAL